MNREGPFCDAQRRHGAGICRRPAGAGTSHLGRGRCSWHGGTSPAHQAHDRQVVAQETCEALGIPVRTTAVSALRDELNRANAVVRFLYARCAALTPAELVAGEWVTLLESWSRRVTDIAAVSARLEIDWRAAETSAALGGRAVSALEAALDGAGITGAPRLRLLQLLAGGGDG